MGEKGEGSGVVGGGKWGRRGREVGGKGEGTGNGVPPCPPPQFDMQHDIVLKKLNFDLLTQSPRVVGEWGDLRTKHLLPCCCIS